MRQLSLFDSGEFYNFPHGLLEFRENFLTPEEASLLQAMLISKSPWKQKTPKPREKTVITPLLTAWFGDGEKAYKLGGSEFEVNSWTPELLSVKEKIEGKFGYEFNSVLLNLCRNNSDSVAWHRDKEKRYGERPVIASISLGETRKFDFRKVDDPRRRYSLPLPHGSLLIMKGDLQENWQHRIAKSAHPVKEQINLTFRLMREI